MIIITATVITAIEMKKKLIKKMKKKLIEKMKKKLTEKMKKIFDETSFFLSVQSYSQLNAFSTVVH